MKISQHRTRHCLVPTIALYSCLFFTSEAIALPPPEDVPEEILRTEIITEARSAIDGQPLTAAEYALYADKEHNLERRKQASLPGTQGSAIACPPQDFLPCVSNNPAPGDESGAFSATNHILNKLPIRYLLRQMFPF